MSIESFAAFRKTASDDLGELAEQHLKHDLQDQDRQILESSAKSFRNYAAIGSAIGLGLGLLLAFRVRSARTQMFKAFRAQEKPSMVKFPSGREESIPDLTNMLKPSTLGDFAAYSLFAAGGIFLGGELGALGGSLAVSSKISKDPESKQRIETAFRRFRADILRKEAAMLEQGEMQVKGF